MPDLLAWFEEETREKIPMKSSKMGGQRPPTGAGKRYVAVGTDAALAVTAQPIGVGGEEFCQRTDAALADANETPPFFVCLTLVGTKGCTMGVNSMLLDDQQAISQDMLVLPEVTADELATEPAKILRPIFDMVWNACGFERSLNYDEKGDWKARG